MPNPTHTILAFGAHPDDLEFGLGGILLLQARAGLRLQLCVCSRGEAASHGTPEIRTQEAEQAARILGAGLTWLEAGGDGRMSASRELALSLALQIRQHRPALVFAPLPDENQHPDHAVIGQCVRDAARLARYGGLAPLRDSPAHAIAGLYFYAVTNVETTLPRVLVAVSPVVEDWKTLMACHASQLQTRQYIDWQISRARILGLSAGVEYAQAVFPSDPPVCDEVIHLYRTARNF